VEQRADNPEEAAETYRQVLASETCRASSSVTAVTAAANLALALWQLGRSAEAAAVLGEHEALFRDHADDRARPLVMNVRGRVAWALGHRVEAERLLLEARNDLIAQKSPLYAAVVSLDLAVLYLEDGRTAEVKRMARLVGEMFESEEVDPLVTAALMVFRTALAAERLTVEAIRTLQRQLDEARQGPVQRKRP
jgi:tetratricopeptide (TPR) repeat protein